MRWRLVLIAVCIVAILVTSGVLYMKRLNRRIRDAYAADSAQLIIVEHLRQNDNEWPEDDRSNTWTSRRPATLSL